jgi:hypothetical protein
MAQRSAERRQHKATGPVQRTGLETRMDEHLAAIHRLLERDAADQRRVGSLSQLFATSALMAGVALYLVSRSPLIRAAKDAHRHIFLQPPAPDATTVLLVTLALLTGAVLLARAFRGIAASLVVSMTPMAIAVCVGFSGLGADVEPSALWLECVLGAAMCAQYITLHRKGLKDPTQLPISPATTAAIQLLITTLTAAQGALIIYLNFVMTPSGYRGQPGVSVVGVALGVTAPAVTTVLMRHVAIGFPRRTHRDPRDAPTG